MRAFLREQLVRSSYLPDHLVNTEYINLQSYCYPNLINHIAAPKAYTVSLVHPSFHRQYGVPVMGYGSYRLLCLPVHKLSMLLQLYSTMDLIAWLWDYHIEATGLCSRRFFLMLVNLVRGRWCWAPYPPMFVDAERHEMQESRHGMLTSDQEHW